MFQQSSTPYKYCQACNHDKLESVLFVGFIPPVNTMPKIGATAVEGTTYPLEMIRCANCGLVQVGIEVNQEVLFPESYPYLSGMTKILIENFSELEIEASSILSLSKDELIIDIGSNDGTLLNAFKNKGYPVLGVEPSQAADVANKLGIETIKSYFNSDLATEISNRKSNVQLVTAANVFAHINNVHDLSLIHI